MGSLKRKLQREQQKRAYGKFATAFRDEKRRQRETPTEADPKLPLLGHRPNFRHFVEQTRIAAETLRAKALAAEQEKLEQEKKLDLEWKDE